MLTLLLSALIQAPVVDAEPDVVLRGRSARLVLRGRDTTSLKTLQVSPPDGITIRAITPLPARRDGSAAVSVDLMVDAAANPGERTLVLTTAAVIYTASGRRSGADSVAGAMDALLTSMTRDRTHSDDAGVLYVNSHEITITGVVVGKGETREVRITATDATGDVETPPAAVATGASGAAITLVPASSELVISEARCGRDIYDSVLEDAVVRETRSGSVLVTASLPALTLEGAGACTLRVRVRDKAGNTSPWFTTPLDRR